MPFLFPIYTVLLSVFFVLAYVAIRVYESRISYPSQIVWLNKRNNDIFFPYLRARFRTLRNFRSTLMHAYTQYSKNGEPCIVGTLDSTSIVLPPNCTEWIARQAEDILSAYEPHLEGLQSDYTFPDPCILQNPIQSMTIRQDLNRQMALKIPDMMDEIVTSFEEVWGSNTEDWREVEVMSSMQTIVARTSNRVFVGKSLCSNPALLRTATQFSRDVVITSYLLRLFPALIRPVVATIITIPNRRNINAFINVLRPEIVRRKAATMNCSYIEDSGSTEQNDYLQWTLRAAISSKSDKETSLEVIAGRLLAVNFAAMHTSTLAISNILLDLASAAPQYELIATLREELVPILASENGVWSKKGLAQLPRMDSLLRESSRLNFFQGIGIVRKVKVPGGVIAPNGTHCPYGSLIAAPTLGIHNDVVFYHDPEKFDPYRFSKGSPDMDGQPITDQTDVKAFVTTDATFHAFGHGKHACVGRFFASAIFKLMLSHLLLNYDVEYQPIRPETKFLGPVQFPPANATIRIKRRKFASM
ncbi:cytochrome P450 [Talaromyces proteolyticus]|uniref:Cytochrome P450 n=1 Tax=Talaromyces proteolyticus TaxID=1131652 RepID=A0AAD4PVI7_9EURO|nr:cytochrome P450 [Talaromyces proteolyticus]KAH8690328.1 cytochrome P450 [Talaromyces proteolyticus]